MKNVIFSSNVDTSILNDKKQAPVHLVTELNKVSVLQVMSKYTDHIDILQGGEHGRTALHLAAIYDHEECARILVSIYRVSQEERSIFWEVIISVIQSKKLFMNMYPVPNGFRDRAI
jgi:ankyrin repeat protein